jgi:hypothetical protein
MNIADKSFTENTQKHIICTTTLFFRKTCRLWERVEKYFTAGWATYDKRRMRISCWIPTATNPLSEYLILIAFPRQQWSQERASVSRYAACTLLVLLNLIVCLKITTEVTKSLWFCKVFMSSSKFPIIMEDKIMWLVHVFGIQIDNKISY